MKKSLYFLLSVLSLALPLKAEEKSLQIQNGQKVAFMGDSITAFGWGYPGGYVRLVADGLNQQGIKIDVDPAGVSGNTSKDMLARLDRDVLSKKPDWMTLSCGVNDVWHGASGVDLETYKQNITAIVDQATAQGIKMVILTATPIGENDNDNNQKLAAYNEFLRQLAKERNLPLADLSADFHAALGKYMTSADSRNLTVDGVHMNPEGNVVMAKGVLRAFGISDKGTESIEQNWLFEPNTAAVAYGSFDPRPSGLGITLGEFRKVSAVAHERAITPVQLSLSLWMQAFGEAIQAHQQDEVINAEGVKKDANAILLKKIEALPQPKAATPKSAT